MHVMEKTTLVAFRFPQRLTAMRKDAYEPQEVADFLKINPSYFHQSFQRKFKPKPVEADARDIPTGEPMLAIAVNPSTMIVVLRRGVG